MLRNASMPCFHDSPNNENGPENGAMIPIFTGSELAALLIAAKAIPSSIFLKPFIASP